MSTRVYLPFTVRELRALAESPERALRDRRAFAVTAQLRAEYPDGDEEELEYVAMTLAARASAGLLRDADPPRRLVVAWDATQVVDGDDEHPFEVEVAELRLPRDVASYHLDEPAAGPDVVRAREAWRTAPAGWEEVVARTDRHDLGWWAAQELDAVLALGSDSST